MKYRKIRYFVALSCISLCSGCHGTSSYELLHYERIRCAPDKRARVLDAGRNFSNREGMRFSARMHSPNGLRFIIEIDDSSEKILINGFLPETSYGTILQDGGNNVTVFDETGGVPGTSHDISLSVHSPDGNRSEASDRVMRLRQDLLSVCS